MKKITTNIGYLVLTAASIVSCKSGEGGADPRVVVRAQMQSPVMARAQTSPEALPDGEYHLYLPAGSINRPVGEGMVIRDYTLSEGSFAADPLYWDDIIADPADKGNTAYYFTNETRTSFPQGTTKDILWATTRGWMRELEFELEHCMAQFSVTIVDQTIGNALDMKNANVRVAPGLILKAVAFDNLTGEITADDRREETTSTVPLTAAEAQRANAEHRHTFAFGTLPGQLFEPDTRLEITAGKYVFRVAMPETLSDGITPMRLERGEHVQLTIVLTEETVEMTASLEDWTEKREEPMEVTRVFNISNMNELRDMLLAVNTGYSFEGMVVRMTGDIEITGQIGIGTREFPFKGIFDGNGKVITGLCGEEDNAANLGGLFGYTEGATLQNITIAAPSVRSRGGEVGALVDRAVNTTIFNCSVIEDNGAEGIVYGEGNYTGGLVGYAAGKTTINNSYSVVAVQAPLASDYAGGLVGYTEGTITHCSAKSHVVGGSFTGGLAGYAAGRISNCFAWGDVTSANGGAKSGGLAGSCDADVTNSYAAGTVSGSVDAGGLIGSVGFGVAVRHCCWNRGRTNGLGAGTLDETCTAFALGDDITPILGTNNPLVWRHSSDIVLNDQHRMAIFQ